MGATTAISWCDATFNPWIGCTRVAAECDHCYAETLALRYHWLDAWGAKTPRKRTSPANWRKPLAWDRAAAASGTRPRVFCASLADVFDAEIPDAWRTDLWALIRQTVHLDWLVLTKRSNLISHMLPPDWGAYGWPHVWLGTSVGEQASAWRIPHLLKVPAAQHFLSCEPLLGPLNLRAVPYRGDVPYALDVLAGRYATHDPVHRGTPFSFGLASLARISWVIAGGESGPNYRPMDPAWARSLQRQCAVMNVPFWWKQTSGPRSGLGTRLDGVEYHQLPEPRWRRCPRCGRPMLSPSAYEGACGCDGGLVTTAV